MAFALTQSQGQPQSRTPAITCRQPIQSFSWRTSGFNAYQPIPRGSLSIPYSPTGFRVPVVSRLRGGKGGASKRSGDRVEETRSCQPPHANSDSASCSPLGVGLGASSANAVGHVVFSAPASGNAPSGGNLSVWRRRSSSLDAASSLPATPERGSSYNQFADASKHVQSGSIHTVPSRPSATLRSSTVSRSTAGTGKTAAPAQAAPSRMSFPPPPSPEVSFHQSTPRKGMTASASSSAASSSADVISNGSAHFVAEVLGAPPVPIRMVNPSVMLHARDSTAASAMPAAAAATVAAAATAPAKPSSGTPKGKGAKKASKNSAPGKAKTSAAGAATPPAHSGRSPTAKAQPPEPRAEAEADPLEGDGWDASAQAGPRDELDVYRGLVLDCAYRPINVVCWKRALTLEIAEKADVLEYYDAVVNSATQTFPIPAVLRVSSFVHVPKQRRRRLSLSRSSVFLRDKFRCLYCGSREQLTIDHVVPLSRGGGSTWENLATACSPCNLKKANRTPAEASMKLQAVPKEPRELDSHDLPPNYRTYRTIQRFKAAPREWLDWLPLHPQQRWRTRVAAEDEKEQEDGGWLDQDLDTVLG